MSPLTFWDGARPSSFTRNGKITDEQIERLAQPGDEGQAHVMEIARATEAKDWLSLIHISEPTRRS